MEYITDLEKLMKKLDSKPVDEKKPVSENADDAAKRLFDYLRSICGKKHLSGQQYLQREELEDDVYYAETGDLPAIRGYDLMDMDRGYSDDQVTRAIEWAKKTGCIITICWHWYAPDNMDDLSGCEWSFYYKTTTYDHKTSFDLLKAVEYGTKEYEFAVSRIDRAASELRRFEEAGIPVIFRPLHEANGAWFWWGRRKPGEKACIEAYRKLWYMIFDRIENFHKLTNIIWVWNGQDKDMLVHPNTFDIVGDDIYSDKENDHSSQKKRFEYMKSLAYGKMIALTECGYIPAPSEMRKDGAMWLWWLPWWGSFTYAVDKQGKPLTDEQGKAQRSEKYMKGSFLRDTFADESVVTLRRLPSFTGELPDKFTRTE